MRIYLLSASARCSILWLAIANRWHGGQINGNKTTGELCDCLRTRKPFASGGLYVHHAAKCQQTIRTLEHELGRPLLVRSGKGVQPTVYGKNVLEYAKLILRATATISSLAVPDEQNGLRLSAYPSNMVSRLLVDFYKTWGSGIHIEHHEAPWRRSPTMSTKEFLKLESYMWRKAGATFQHILLHKKLEFIPQSEKSICVYVGPQHPLYHADSVDFQIFQI